ncbi:MAG: hypothetical protein ABFD51_06365 [Anaerolineaceae bacterium]
MENHDELRYELLFKSAYREVKTDADLQILVHDLEHLIQSIEEKDTEWLKEFMDKWWILEEYNAIFLNGGNGLRFSELITKINELREDLLDLIKKKC